MRLDEAMKTGKPFKRKLASAWHTKDIAKARHYTQEDILADDWVIEEEILTIGISDFFTTAAAIATAKGGSLDLEDLDRVWEALKEFGMYSKVQTGA